MQDFFICELCGNDDQDKVGKRNGLSYCRACLPFQGEKAPLMKHQPLNLPIKLDYDLTDSQLRISEKLVTFYKKQINTLVYAVCGAGKTELVYAVMQYALSQGHQIGFTVPRREVVIEITTRIKETFPKAKVISVFGDHHDVLTGNMIVLTTHQLFRYPHYFDLLIFDEIDAFPYKGDLVLESFFKRSVKGAYILLSATPSDTLLKTFEEKGKVLTLFTRFHHHQIPVPVTRRGYFLFNFNLLYVTLKRFFKIKKPVLVFAPTIRLAEVIYQLLKLDFKGGNLVHSKVADNSKIISDFKKGIYRYLVTTTVLERGVTIKGLQVIIYGADHPVYDAASLIQISGRVGRKKEESDGEVIFIITKENKAIRKAIADIKSKNTYLQTMFQKEGAIAL
ncbi:MAG: helicase-related protein [Bacilli bacterium]